MHKVTALSIGTDGEGRTRVWDNYGRLVENMHDVFFNSTISKDAAHRLTVYMSDAYQMHDYLHGVRRLAIEKVVIDGENVEMLFRTDDACSNPGRPILHICLSDPDLSVDIAWISIEEAAG